MTYKSGDSATCGDFDLPRKDDWQGIEALYDCASCGAEAADSQPRTKPSFSASSFRSKKMR